MRKNNNKIIKSTDKEMNYCIGLSIIIVEILFSTECQFMKIICPFH